MYLGRLGSLQESPGGSQPPPRVSPPQQWALICSWEPTSSLQSELRSSEFPKPHAGFDCRSESTAAEGRLTESAASKPLGMLKCFWMPMAVRSLQRRQVILKSQYLPLQALTSASQTPGEFENHCSSLLLRRPSCIL